jgi:hypothetical protein
VAGPGSQGQSSNIRISHVVTDPTWSLRLWPLDVHIGNVAGTIPALPAADWLVVLMATDLGIWDIVPGMCPDLEDDLDEALIQGDVNVSDIRDIALEVIATVSSRPWWFTLRLIAVVTASWETIGGDLVLHGVDATKVSLGAWLDAALLLCLRAMDPKDVTMFMSQLEAAPAGEEVAELEMDRHAFLALG